MKILFTQYFEKYAGSEKYIYELCLDLKKKYTTPVVFYIYKSKNSKKMEEYTSLFSKNNICAYSIKIDSFGVVGVFRIIKFLHQIINKEKIKIIHSNLIYADLISAIYKVINRKIKTISTKHGYKESYLKQYNCQLPLKKDFSTFRLLSYLAEVNIDHSIVVSQGLSKILFNLAILRKGKYSVIYHGLEDKQNSNLEKDTLRYEVNQILLVGRLTPYKGQEYAIRMLPRLLKTFPLTMLVLVGPGEDYKTYLERLAVELGIEENVRFEGYQTNVDEYMRSSDILLVTSKVEPFGFVFLEAFMNKIPVVAFDVFAGNEIINHKETGFLVKAYDVDELSDKVIELLRAPEDRKNIVEKARLKITNCFNRDRVLQETLLVYEDTLS